VAILVLAGPARAREIRGGGLWLRAEENAAGVSVRIGDEVGIDYADGPVLYEFELPNARRVVLVPQITRVDEKGVTILARAEELQVEHQIEPAGDGFEERISVLNHSSKPVDVADYRFALRRGEQARGELRAVAVPFRRQADGKLRDWTLA
jgi:hypothetical protein